MIDKTAKQAILEQFSQTLPATPPDDGILLVDKPSGPTSHDIVYLVKKKYGLKVGHTGTLDPLASGLLILLLGQGTKRAKEFEGLDKVYEVEAVFGEARDTYDAEGTIMQNLKCKIQNLKSLCEDDIKAILPEFTGPISQRVPPFSAVKINGKALYRYAREGNPIPEDQLPVKEITIHELTLLDFHPVPKEILEIKNFVLEIADAQLPIARLQVHCSKGTYIRSLVHDLGMRLGVGAYVNKLRRIAVGGYQLP